MDENRKNGSIVGVVNESGHIISLEFSNCDISIQQVDGSYEFNNEIDIGENIKELFKNTDGKFSLITNSNAHPQLHSVRSLIFNECVIKSDGVNEPNIGFSGANNKVRFNSCSFSSGLVFRAKITFDGLNVNVPSIQFGTGIQDADKQVSVSGSSFILNESIEFELYEKDTIEIDSLDGYLNNLKPSTRIRLSGTCKKIYFKSSFDNGEMTVSFADNFSCEELNLGDAGIVFDGVECGTFSSIKIYRNVLILNSIKQLSRLEIDTEIMGLKVLNVDLSNTDLVIGEKTNINLDEFVSLGSTWKPEKITYRGFNPKMNIAENSTNILSARQFFSEMKTRFSEKGDSITAGDFYVSEMLAHKAYLQTQKRSFSNFAEFLSLWFSQHSSDFGQNWIKASSWYFGLSFIFALIFSLNIHSLRGFSNVLFHFLSPISIDFPEVKRLTKVPYYFAFIWLVWKIISSYLTYQIIISFRRFTRKF